MKTIAIIQHAPYDGPAFFAEWLTEYGIPFEVFAMYEGGPLPRAINDHVGLCILGGPMSANDDLPYFPRLQSMVREAMEQDIPVIGHCLGGQIMSLACGGRVTTAPFAEIGWSHLAVVHAEGAQWFGLSPELRLFQWHGEAFSLPPGATPLVTGTYCPEQAFVMDGKHLGMQFHCEVDAPKIENWLVTDAAEIHQSDSPAVQSASDIVAHLAQDVSNSQTIARHIYARWAQGLKL